MVSLTTYICLVAGLLLCAANAFVFYAALKKRKPFTVDILVGSLCLHSIVYYMAYGILLIIQKLTNWSQITLKAGECVDCYFAFSFPIILSVFFIDRYLATSHPLFYKLRVINRHAYIVLFTIIVLSISLTVFTMVRKQFTIGSVTVNFSYFLCVFIITIASFVVMVICYISICRALLFFAGRQMYIFGNEAMFRKTLPTIVENTHTDSTEDSTEINVSNNETENSKSESESIPPQQVVVKEKLCRKKSSLPTVLREKSVTLSGDDKKNFLAARAARYSCPICVESKYQPDLPLWLIASLSNELKEVHHVQRPRAQTLPVKPQENQVQENQPCRKRASTIDQLASNKEFGRLPRARTYTMCNVVVNLIATRRKKETDRGLRLSQARHLVQILTTKLVFYLFWLPFLVSDFARLIMYLQSLGAIILGFIRWVQ